MATFHVTVEAGCGLSLNVEAKDEAEARRAAIRAMYDHMDECDGFTADIHPDEDPDAGSIIAVPGITDYITGYEWADE